MHMHHPAQYNSNITSQKNTFLSGGRTHMDCNPTNKYNFLMIWKIHLEPQDHYSCTGAKGHQMSVQDHIHFPGHGFM